MHLPACGLSRMNFFSKVFFRFETERGKQTFHLLSALFRVGEISKPRRLGSRRREQKNESYAFISISISFIHSLVCLSVCLPYPFTMLCKLHCLHIFLQSSHYNPGKIPHLTLSSVSLLCCHTTDMILCEHNLQSTYITIYISCIHTRSYKNICNIYIYFFY